MSDYFTGQHEKILLKAKSNKSNSFNELVLALGEDNKAKSFSELDRLSLVVHQIDFDTAVVPIGAYKILPTLELVRNPNFRGLKI